MDLSQIGNRPTEEDMEGVPDPVIEYLLKNPKMTMETWYDLMRELRRRWANGSTILQDVPLECTAPAEA